MASWIILNKFMQLSKLVGNIANCWCINSNKQASKQKEPTQWNV